MKACIKNRYSLPALVAAHGLILASRVTAQPFTTLHSFTSSDGTWPYAGLLLADGTLYGTTVTTGGVSGRGTVFAVNTDSTGFTNLYTFSGFDDGSDPWGDLILSSNALYGTTENGGSSAQGTVFAVNKDGTGFRTIYSFTATDPDTYINSDGAKPVAGLVLSGNTLYGTARWGGSSGNGTVFAVHIDGTGFTILHDFTGAPFNRTNTDGAVPRARLILSGNNLYGTASAGGSSDKGTVFAVNTDGTGFTNLHSFTGGSDGAIPTAGLILSGNTLYGTAYSGSTSGKGTVFAINRNGTGFTNLHTFTATSDSSPYVNTEGAYPWAGLILSGNTLHGTASIGGSLGEGTVFAVNTDGTAFANLHDFTGSTDGAGPYASLILYGNTLYGTAQRGGSSGSGTVFSLSLPPPQLTIIHSGANVVLTWPTNTTGFTLQSTTNLVSPAVWTTVSSGPVVVNGQSTVTNPVSGPRKFYRLSQ